MLQLFWDLADNSKEKRLEAAHELVSKHLVGNRSEIPPSVNRLVRGLSSNRDSARLGFCLALTEALKTISLVEMNVSNVLDLLDKHSLITSSISGKDERDALFAKLFGILAILNSELISSSTEWPLLERILNTLLFCYNSKVYLQLPACNVLIKLIQIVKENSEIRSKVLDRFFAEGISSPEQLWVALECQRMELDIEKYTKINKKWSNVHLLAAENLTTLSEVLKETTTNHPNLHPIWKCILSRISSSSSSNENQVISMAMLWTRIVDGLFDSSHERKYLGFLLFIEIISNSSYSDATFLFSQRFMRCFMNSLATKKTYLHKMALKVNEAIEAFVSKNKEASISILLLVCEYDRKGPLAKNLVENLDKGGSLQYFNYLQNLFSESKQDDTPEKIHARKMYAIDQMHHILRESKVEKSPETISACLEFFVIRGFFSLGNEEDVEESTLLLQQVAQKRLLAILNDLYHLDRSYGKHGIQVLRILEAQLKAQPKDSFILSGSQGFIDAASFVKSTIPKESEKEKDVFCSFVVHLFIHAMVEDSFQVFEDLKAVHSRLFEKKEENQKKKKRKVDQETKDISPFDVLLDIILNSLAKPCVLLRTVSEHVFRIFCHGITVEGLSVLFETLKRTTRDQEEEEDEDLEDFEDVEMMEADQEEEEEEDESSSGSSEEGESSSEEDSGAELSEDDEPLSPELLELAEQQMGQGEEELSDLDDDQMAEFDKKLAEILRHRKEMKKAKKEIKESMTHYKQRLLDLIDIYVKKAPNTLVIPHLLKFFYKSHSTDSPFKGKLEKILLKLAKSKTLHGQDVSEVLESYKKKGKYVKVLGAVCDALLHKMKNSRITPAISE